MLLKASLSQEDLRTQTAEKAQNFEQNYRKMIRYGFLAITIIVNLPDTDVQSGIEKLYFWFFGSYLSSPSQHGLLL